VLTIIKEELTKILGNNTTTINTDKSLVKIMMIGLQGSGKTTTCAKIANYYKKKFNKKPLLVGIDIYRPAAIEQLRTLAKENGIDFFEKGTQNPVITADEALTFAKTNGNNIIIFDTAGRLQTDEVMMEELKNVRNKISPDEILLVIDAMSGQEIVNVASEFNNTLHISGLVITKLDGDTRAGAALSLVSILKKPIKFTGVGEKIGSLELFHPSRMASRILGLGDILTLAEKSKDLMDENVVKKSFARMLAGKMDLEDLMVQMSQLGKMGPLSSISKMMPGANNISETQIAEAQEKMRI
jgi:signal recognition particle subunit SRP54